MEDIQKIIDKLVDEIGITGVLIKVIISNVHFREAIQDKPEKSVSDIAYIHSIPALNYGIEKLIDNFRRTINK